jgi:hypothetical protein
MPYLAPLRRLPQFPQLSPPLPSELMPLVQVERRVSVELHPVSSLGLGGLAAPSLQGAGMNNLLRNYT